MSLILVIHILFHFSSNLTNSDAKKLLEVQASLCTIIFCAAQNSTSVENAGRKIISGIWQSSAQTVDTFLEADKNANQTIPVKVYIF